VGELDKQQLVGIGGSSGGDTMEAGRDGWAPEAWRGGTDSSKGTAGGQLGLQEGSTVVSSELEVWQAAESGVTGCCCCCDGGAEDRQD